MLVDDYNEPYPNRTTEHTFPKNNLLKEVLKSLENTPKYFFKALNDHPNKDSLNEDGLTQIFIEQNHLQILELAIPIHVGAQYIDTYLKTRGKPDIYYTLSEEGKSHKPLFIVEAKRLPPPEKRREKEYVLGTTSTGNPNGGIERFKLEKHGAGLKECGLLAYIEADTPKIWLEKINKWILELEWSIDEHLRLNLEDKYFSKYSSKCNRKNDSMILHHFWLHQHEQNS